MEYDPSEIIKIAALSDFEKIRARPGMYIGRNYDENGLYFIIEQIAELSLNPIFANENLFLEIAFLNGSKIRLTDHGRGLPNDQFEISQQLKLPKIELTLTKLWRNRFDEAYFKEFGFLNYLGLVVNVTSTELELSTDFQGNYYFIHCSKGEVVESSKHLNTLNQVGTTIEFAPDQALFGVQQIKTEKLAEITSSLSLKYPEATIILKNE